MEQPGSLLEAARALDGVLRQVRAALISSNLPLIPPSSPLTSVLAPQVPRQALALSISALIPPSPPPLSVRFLRRGRPSPYSYLPSFHPPLLSAA